MTPSAYPTEAAIASTPSLDVRSRWVDLVIAAAELIAAYMAAGESLVSRADLKRSGRYSDYTIGSRQEQLLLRYLVDSGHLERHTDRELIRPIGIRPPELPLASQFAVELTDRFVDDFCFDFVDHVAPNPVFIRRS